MAHPTAAGRRIIADIAYDTLIGAPIPEPSTWAMLIAGFAALGFAGWRVKLYGGPKGSA